MKLIRLEGAPIWEQLAIEEALLRADSEEWCLINSGSAPSVVVGISGKVESLVNLDETSRQKVPVYRRFSGGGTVIVDEETLFVTLIGNESSLPCPSFPEPLMRWTAEIYSNALSHPDFALQENDYALGPMKFGGNAQYLRKGRWLHHTSLLWDFCPEKMQCLKMPSRTPSYREGRSHGDFLCRLRDHFSSKQDLADRLIAALGNRFSIESASEEEIGEILERPHRKATQLVHR